jgi:hypothetical protein
MSGAYAPCTVWRMVVSRKRALRRVRVLCGGVALRSAGWATPCVEPSSLARRASAFSSARCTGPPGPPSISSVERCSRVRVSSWTCTAGWVGCTSGEPAVCSQLQQRNRSVAALRHVSSNGAPTSSTRAGWVRGIPTGVRTAVQATAESCRVPPGVSSHFSRWRQGAATRRRSWGGFRR